MSQKEFSWSVAHTNGVGRFIKSITNTPTKSGTKTKIEFHDRMRAIETLDDWLDLKNGPWEMEERIGKVARMVLMYHREKPDVSLEVVTERFAYVRDLPQTTLFESVLKLTK